MSKTLSTKDDIKSEINRENYYDFLINSPVQGKLLKTDWLRKDEALNNIINYMTKWNYKIKTNIIYEIEDSTRVLIDIFEPSENFGLIFQDGHKIPIKIADRLDTNSFKYSVYNNFGIPRSEYQKQIPSNIFIFKKDWYQSCENIKTVTKKDAINILKQDLELYLKILNK